MASIVAIIPGGTAENGHSCVRPQLSDGSINKGSPWAAAKLKHNACLFLVWQHMKWTRESGSLPSPPPSQPRCPALMGRRHSGHYHSYGGQWAAIRWLGDWDINEWSERCYFLRNDSPTAVSDCCSLGISIRVVCCVFRLYSILNLL